MTTRTTLAANVGTVTTAIHVRFAVAAAINAAPADIWATQAIDDNALVGD